uniref:Uncharacterized protein n=1 Tax=Anguilla anguilla TaxID=7936 RepID=A0A0E9R9F5_ANGAN
MASHAASSFSPVSALCYSAVTFKVGQLRSSVKRLSSSG